MTGITPNYEDWRLLSSISIWEVAVLMHGFDPRALGDVTVRDPHNPENVCGVPLDTSWEKRALCSAVAAGTLKRMPSSIQDLNDETGVLVSSLIPWLQSNGYGGLAEKLNGSPQAAVAASAPAANHPAPTVSEAARRLLALRALGGTAKSTGRWGDQACQFTKVKRLAEQEKLENRPRSSEKTVRKDLIEAIKAEKAESRSPSSSFLP